MQGINGKIATSGEAVVIDNDSNVKYISLCPHCYYEEIDKNKVLK